MESMLIGLRSSFPRRAKSVMEGTGTLLERGRDLTASVPSEKRSAVKNATS